MGPCPMVFQFMEAPSLLCLHEFREKKVSFYLPECLSVSPGPWDSMLRRLCRNMSRGGLIPSLWKSLGFHELARE